MDYTCESSTHGRCSPNLWSLKTRSCFGLDSWIIHAWEVFDWWTYIFCLVFDTMILSACIKEIIILSNFNGVGATIRIGWESRCLPYVWFVWLLIPSQDSWLQDSGFRIQEEGCQSFSYNQAIDSFLHKILKQNKKLWRHPTMYLQTLRGQCEYSTLLCTLFTPRVCPSYSTIHYLLSCVHPGCNLLSRTVQ